MTEMNNNILIAESIAKNVTTIDKLIAEGFNVDRVRDMESAQRCLDEQNYGMVLTSSHLNPDTSNSGWRHRQLGLVLAMYSAQKGVPLIGHLADGNMYSTELNRAITRTFRGRNERNQNRLNVHSKPEDLSHIRLNDSLVVLADCLDFPVFVPEDHRHSDYRFDIGQIQDANDTGSRIKDYHAFARTLQELGKKYS